MVSHQRPPFSAVLLLQMPPRSYTKIVTIGNISIYQVSADPNGVFPATLGSMAIRSDTAVVYQNTDGAMAWTVIGGGLPPVIGVPGAVIIENSTGTAYEQRRLRQSDIDPDFAISSFSVTGASLIETGDTYNNPSFTASYNVPTPTLTQADLQDNQGGGVQNVLPTPTSFSYTGSYGGLAGPLGTPNASVQWTLTANNGVSGDTANDSVQSATRTYHGPAVDPGGGGYNEAFIESLNAGTLKTNRNFTYTDTAAVGEYLWHSLPTRLGTPTFTVGGFVEPYTLQATVSVTNAFGFTENYGLWRGVNPGSGTLTVVVS